MANQIGDREVSITVCANSDDELALWVRAFVDFFGNSTRVHAKGSWEDEHGVTWHEDNVIVSHLYLRDDPDYDPDQLNVLIQEYKCGAEQECVLVTYRPVEAFLA
jgi:hypothetical protein